ncbi:MAG: Ig-like domain-containing protein [bacterium]|nr:Ig-like domain-containing protein [bacterium]
MSNLPQKIKIIAFFAIIILAGFGFAQKASAAYYSSGNWTSINLLSGETVSSIDSFIYNLSAKPANTDATIQFSQDNTSWYSSAGVLDGTNTLTTGVDNTIDLSGLSWSGANFYYKITFTSSDGVDTPALDDISVTFSSDTTSPTVSTLSPADNATGVSTTANLVITFDEAVDAEAGASNDIVIKKSSDDSTIETIDAQDVKVTGGGTNTITVNPAATLLELTGYYVQIGADAFDDTAGNSYAGISDTTSWSFTTADETNPTVSTLSPADDATSVATTANLIITFSEAVDAETGNINLYKTTGDVLVQAFNVTTDISGSGTDTITVNPTSNLDRATNYYIKIDATAFDDAAGNSFAGIADSTTWNFITRNRRLIITIEE